MYVCVCIHNTHTQLVMTHSDVLTLTPTFVRKHTNLSPGQSRLSVRLTLGFCSPSTLYMCPCCFSPNPSALGWRVFARSPRMQNAHRLDTHLGLTLKGAPHPAYILRSLLGTQAWPNTQSRGVGSPLCGHGSLRCFLVFVFVRFFVFVFVLFLL